MASLFPIPGLSATLGGYGKLFRPPSAVPAFEGEPPGIVAVIPALDEAPNVPFALASLARQTVVPDRVVVVDDGSTDGTGEVVEELARELDADVTVRYHEEPRGKTRGVKEVARAADSEKLLVLDADTYLESERYVERLLGAHAREDVACAYGRVLPLTRRYRRAVYEDVLADAVEGSDRARAAVERTVGTGVGPAVRLGYLLGRWPLEQYRNLWYTVNQNFIKDASMRMFGTTLFPVGCGVLYDRERLVAAFDKYEEPLGDDLTNSEDIFLGFEFADQGYANVQVREAYMRTTEPTIADMPGQVYLWGSSFLQSVFYFGGLRTRLRRSDGDDGRTRQPVGRLVLAQLVDGLFPLTLLVLTALVLLHVVATDVLYVTVLAEYALFLLIAGFVYPWRLRLVPRAVVAMPVRLLQLSVGAYTYLRVGFDIVSGRRNWRK